METTENTNIDIDLAKVKLGEYGYVLLPNLISSDTAMQMAERLKEVSLHRSDSANPFQHLGNLFNPLEPNEYESFLPLITNPVVLSLAHHMLGEGFQAFGSSVAWTKPGAQASGIHGDVPMGWFAEHSRPFPKNICFIVQCNWMLTDFTRENGATELLPMSHRLGIPNMWPDENGNSLFMNERVKKLRAELEGGDPNSRLVAAEGSAGSAVVFLGGMWHRSGTNITEDKNRVGVLTPYHARWVEPGWGLGLKDSLLRREVRDRMPAHVREMSWHVTEDYPERDDYPN